MKILQIPFSKLPMFSKAFLDMLTHPMFNFGKKDKNYWIIRINIMADNLYSYFPKETRALGQLLSMTMMSDHQSVMIVDINEESPNN